MRGNLKVGLRKTMQFRIGREKTVPALYPESAEFRAFPEVFATGFMVGVDGVVLHPVSGAGT